MKSSELTPLLFTVYLAAASGRSPALPCFAAFLALVRFSGLFAFTQLFFQTLAHIAIMATIFLVSSTGFTLVNSMLKIGTIISPDPIGSTMLGLFALSLFLSLTRSADFTIPYALISGLAPYGIIFGIFVFAKCPLAIAAECTAVFAFTLIGTVNKRISMKDNLHDFIFQSMERVITAMFLVLPLNIPISFLCGICR